MPPAQKPSPTGRRRTDQRLRIVSSRRLFESRVGTEIVRVGPAHSLR